MCGPPKASDIETRLLKNSRARSQHQELADDLVGKGAAMVIPRYMFHIFYSNIVTVYSHA